MISQCSYALLEAALAGRLPADEEASLQRHLEECETCSARMEQMAGGAAWCQEAASLLAGDELDDAVPVHGDWSEIDFTVEHLEPSDEPGVLGRLGDYDVLEIIGRGGMGVVLKAFDRDLKRCVAIKVLAPHLAHSSIAKKRFAREAQAAAAVVHPNVLAIHHVQPGGRLPFLVMPLVAGESLAERLRAQGTLELKETLRIGMQAGAGLAAAHDQGLVHRDVKPANILLEKGVERAVLTDFGLARAADGVSMTRWGIIAGTPQYMSPEQAKGEPLDGRSDLFSLGCVLYEMATGVSPFRTDSAMATMRRLVEEPPPALESLNPGLPPWFIAIVDRLLEKDPSRRFGSAREVSALLEGCLAHLQQPAGVPLPAALPKPVPQPDSGRRKSRFKGVVAMFTTVGIVVLATFGWLASEPPDIAGTWTGADWGTVVLKKTNDRDYTGTYTDTFGKKPGEIQLEWSRIERRFNGTWREGEDRFGELSVRLVNNEIRGAFTTDTKPKINPATPRLADLTWTRMGENSGRVDSTKTKTTDANTPEAKKTNVDANVIRTLIAQLSDDSYDKREAAQKRLDAIGETALELLRKTAQESTGAEARERAERLVHGIENRLFPFVWRIRGHNTRPNRIVLTPDGQQFVSSGYRSICLGSVTTGKVVLTFGAGPKDRYYQDVAIFADGKRALVGADDRIVRLFDLGTGKELMQFIGHEGGIKGVAILPGEKRAVTGGKDKLLRLWEIETGKQLAPFPDVTEGIRCLMLSPDGQTVAVGYYGEGNDPSGRIRLWHVEEKKEIREFSGHTREVTRVSFSSDGKRLVSSSFDRTVRIWDVASGKELRRFNCGSVMECAYFVDKDRRVLCSGKETDLTLQLWDVEQGKRILRSPAVEGGSRDVAPLMGGGSAVAAGVDGFIRLWRWSK